MCWYDTNNDTNNSAGWPYTASDRMNQHIIDLNEKFRTNRSRIGPQKTGKWCPRPDSNQHAREGNRF